MAASPTGRAPPAPEPERLPLDPKLLTGPNTGNGTQPSTAPSLLEAACNGVEIGARHPDRALPRGPDPALQASRLGERKRWLEPVTQVVSDRAAGRSYPVAFTHDEPVNIHMAS